MYHDRTPVYDSPPGIELVLKWRHTWPDKDHDFDCSTDDGQRVGRFYWRNHGTPGTFCWVWVCYDGGGSGSAASPREAAKAVEAAWFDLQQRKAARAT